MTTNGRSFLSLFFLLLSLYVWCTVTMVVEEPDLVRETMSSFVEEEDVHLFGDKFGFTVDIQLEVQEGNEWIIERTATKVFMRSP